MDAARLLHAYGRATDTPDHLEALLSGGPEARRAAVHHLFGSIVHQGTPWTATPEVAKFVAAHLHDPRVAPVRASLVSFLAEVTRSTLRDDLDALAAWADFDLGPFLDGDPAALWEDDRATEAAFAQAVLGCRAALPALVAPVLGALADPDPEVRADAAQAAAELVAAGAVPDADVAERIAARAAAAGVDERAALVLALGAMGAAPLAFLDDPSPAVRACAALHLPTEPRATEVLLDALAHDDPDTWFSSRPPQFPASPRLPLLAAVLARVPDFDRLAELALTVARTTNGARADTEWGPLLAAAFRDHPGEVRTDPQRRFLRALVANEALWDGRFGSPLLWFRKAGLPFDRAACAARCGD